MTVMNPTSGRRQAASASMAPRKTPADPTFVQYRLREPAPGATRGSGRKVMANVNPITKLARNLP